MLIRKALPCDMEAILNVYEKARKFMVDTGNPTQWAGGYPQKDLLEKDIKCEQLYVVEINGCIHAVFFLSGGIDPTYINIENGEWLNDLPYGVIHRIASDGTQHGVLPFCVEFCKQYFDELRIDTHEDNAVMQHLLQKNGFVRCGIIRLADGDARIAYQYSSHGEKV